MSGNATPSQQRMSGSHQRRQSNGEMTLNTNFGNNQSGFSGMMPSSSSFQSPAHPQGGFDMTMDSPYLDPSVGMQMDYNVEQNLSRQPSSSDVSQMNLYGQAQFNQPMVNSPMQANASQGTPMSGHGMSQDHRGGGGSGMSTQHGNMSTGSRSTIGRHISRTQSLQLQEMTSPAHRSGGLSRSMSQQASSQHRRDGRNQGFAGQPQHPQPGSRQDLGIGNSSNAFDGINGPVPVDTSNYNPNNQGFGWDPPEGGWPSTMINRPHTHTSYKNAYSSTGFDMLGVLVRSRQLDTHFVTDLFTDARCNTTQPRNQHRRGRLILRLRCV